jgi:hypothetical protein
MADATQGTVRKAGVVGQNTIQLNEFGEQLIAGGLPPYAEMARKGRGWGTMSTSAVAGLVVRPSTVAAFEIFNGNAPGG